MFQVPLHCDNNGSILVLFIILFDVSKLMMLKKELIIASINVVESEWVDLRKISCCRL
jgi:hypothetical protein